MPNTDQPRGHVEPDGSIHNGKFTNRTNATHAGALVGASDPWTTASTMAPGYEFEKIDNPTEFSESAHDLGVTCLCGNSDTGDSWLMVEGEYGIPVAYDIDVVPEKFEGTMLPARHDHTGDEGKVLLCFYCGRGYDAGKFPQEEGDSERVPVIFKTKPQDPDVRTVLDRVAEANGWY